MNSWREQAPWDPAGFTGGYLKLWLYPLLRAGPDQPGEAIGLIRASDRTIVRQYCCGRLGSGGDEIAVCGGEDGYLLCYFCDEPETVFVRQASRRQWKCLWR